MSARPNPLLRAGGVVLLIVLLPVGYYLHLKRLVGERAEVQGVDWNPSHTCSITTYSSALGEDSVRARFIRLFSAPAFFRVYDAQGRLLKSSEWHLFEHEVDDEAPRWLNDAHVIYPTASGYEAWSLPECTR